MRKHFDYLVGEEETAFLRSFVEERANLPAPQLSLVKEASVVARSGAEKLASRFAFDLAILEQAGPVGESLGMCKRAATYLSGVAHDPYFIVGDHDEDFKNLFEKVAARAIEVDIQAATEQLCTGLPEHLHKVAAQEMAAVGLELAEMAEAIKEAGPAWTKLLGGAKRAVKGLESVVYPSYRAATSPYAIPVMHAGGGGILNRAGKATEKAISAKGSFGSPGLTGAETIKHLPTAMSTEYRTGAMASADARMQKGISRMKDLKTRYGGAASPAEQAIVRQERLRTAQGVKASRADRQRHFENIQSKVGPGGTPAFTPGSQADIAAQRAMADQGRRPAAATRLAPASASASASAATPPASSPTTAAPSSAATGGSTAPAAGGSGGLGAGFMHGYPGGARAASRATAHAPAPGAGGGTGGGAPSSPAPPGGSTGGGSTSTGPAPSGGGSGGGASSPPPSGGGSRYRSRRGRPGGSSAAPATSPGGGGGPPATPGGGGGGGGAPPGPVAPGPAGKFGETWTKFTSGGWGSLNSAEKSQLLTYGAGAIGAHRVVTGRDLISGDKNN